MKKQLLILIALCLVGGSVFAQERTSKRERNELGIHAIRGGSIVGEHSVMFIGNDEVIEINHIATSKQVFATGAIRAAQFLKDKQPGLYSMQDLVAQIAK